MFIISNINATVNDLTKVIACSFKEKNMPFNECSLQNIIYQIKMDLGKNSSLFDELPFYWYYDGPLSEPVRNSFIRITKYCVRDRGNLILKDNYFTEFNRNGNLFPEFLQVKSLCNNLLNKGDYIYSGLAEDIYKKYSPFEILYPFKYGIFNPAVSDKFSADGDEYADIFLECQCNLFWDDLFYDFSDMFSLLSMQIDLLNACNLIAPCWHILRKPVADLWFTFAEGLRIKVHDEYYDCNCGKWNVIFKNSLKQLNGEIESVLLKTDELIDYSGM